MKAKIILSVIAASTILSCSVAYKTGQTPDDVYYSPKKDIESGVTAQVFSDDDRVKESDPEILEEGVYFHKFLSLASL